VSEERCRFAPTPSGPAHPGTLLAALLCWLDARSRDAAILLRIEDVDATRCTAEKAKDMQAALRWLGLDWDEIALQSEHRPAHEAALDALEQRGVLYPCSCSRSAIQRVAARAADGSWRYPGTCRDHALPRGGWRATRAALRVRLESKRLAPLDEGGADLAQDPALALGDPVLRSRDGSIAYQLAVVVDDAAARISRVVRGRDLVASTATQVALQQLLGVRTPIYRHHFLLIEERGEKLAKLHGAVGWRALRERYEPETLCGVLAACAGLLEEPRPVRPAELVAAFDWSRVRADDLVVRWDGARLSVRA
jgi:glutamyl/glutaminyl-tRNA synthetase